MRVLRYDNTLQPTPVIRKGVALKDAELAERLASEDFGGWSPQVEAVDWLIGYLADVQPRRMLEFGSGRTTVCWTVMLTRLFGPDGFRLLSIDQDPENVERASKRLEGIPGAESVRIVHAPLVSATVDGLATRTYSLKHLSEQFAWLGPAEFVFVDGPYAEGPCRYGTLPAARPHIQKGARFVLDDALRDKELLTGTLWAKDRMHVEGVLTIGQGLILGRLI